MWVYGNPESMERAAKQQQFSDGYRALFGDLPTSMYYNTQQSSLQYWRSSVGAGDGSLESEGSVLTSLKGH